MLMYKYELMFRKSKYAELKTNNIIIQAKVLVMNITNSTLQKYKKKYRSNLKEIHYTLKVQMFH